MYVGVYTVFKVLFTDLCCVQHSKDTHRTCLLNVWISHVVPRSQYCLWEFVGWEWAKGWG